MTLEAKELSRQTGRVAELYRWRMQAGAVSLDFPEAPEPPGTLVFSNLFLHGTWEVERDEGQTTLSPTYPPVSPDSYVLFNPGAGYLEVWGAYHGPIGGGGAFIFLRGQVGALDGLLPDTEYVVRALAACTSHGAPPLLGFDFGGGFAFPAPGLNEYTWGDYTVTTDGSGNLQIDVGCLDLEVGNVGIVVVKALQIFLNDGETGGGEETGDGLTFPEQAINQTSSNPLVVYAGETYTPEHIVRDPISGTEDGVFKNELEFEIDATANPVAAWFTTGGLPVAPVKLEIWSVHRNDLTEHAEIYSGEIVRVRVRGAKMFLTVARDEALFQWRVPRQLIQPQCNLIVYSRICDVNPILHSFEGVVSDLSANGLEVTVTGLEAFSAALEPPVPDVMRLGALIAPNGRKTHIVSQAGDTVTLLVPSPELAIGQTVRLLKGCDGRHSTCKNVFDNLENRLAFDHLPNRSPHTGAGIA